LKDSPWRLAGKTTKPSCQPRILTSPTIDSYPCRVLLWTLTIGRFKLRTPKELDQYLGELLEALKSIPPLPYIDHNSIKAIRSLISSKSPYIDKPDWSLQALGFIDSQKRLLPKAYAYVPELEEVQKNQPKEISGTIADLKPSRYGFIRDTNGDDYFFHKSKLKAGVVWEALSIGAKVKFQIKAGRSKDEKDEAINIFLE
jgi:cold shock CspA family protein